MSRTIIKKDDKGNIIYHNDTFYEYWYEYNENNNQIYFKQFEWHNETTYEKWYKYVGEKRVEITKEEFEKIKKEKEHRGFINREPVSRFELMEL